MAIRSDLSSQSANMNTPPDLSLGSFISTFSTPGGPSGLSRGRRVSSMSSHTTAPSSAPVATPSPNGGSGAIGINRRKKDSEEDGDEEIGDDVLGTPAVRKWGSRPGSPGGRGKRTSRPSVGGNSKAPPTTLTLRDQEKNIDNLKKENFSIKLRVHFLEERLAELAPDQIDAALKQNINLKIEVQQRGMELKKLKKLVLELERELERLQRGSGSSSRARERELEERLEDRERELRRLQEDRDLEGGVDDRALREAEAHAADLEDELNGAKELLEENMDEIQRLKELVESRGLNGSTSSSDGRAVDRLQRKLDALEDENQTLRAGLQEQAEFAQRSQEEREDLVDEVDSLRLALEDVQRRREAESMERSESRSLILEEREGREIVEGEVNTLRDKLAAATIELQQKEDEIEMKNREIDDLVLEHERIVREVGMQWKGEVEEGNSRIEELKDALAERETESKELRLSVSELEAGTEDLHDKFEEAFAHMEHQSLEKEEQLESANRAIDKLGEQLYVLEDENDRLKEDMERLREEEGTERERLEALSAALKEKVANLKAQLEELTALNESATKDIHAHRTRQEELTLHVDQLLSELDTERQAREQTEAELSSAIKSHESASRQLRREIEAKESSLQRALDDLARTEKLLQQRENELNDVQRSFDDVERETKRVGESATTARFSLQLEVDRLKRDVERLEDELTRTRRERDERDLKSRDQTSALDKLHAENRDLATQLASQTQARLNLSEKLDSTQSGMRTVEGELAVYKSRASELEERLGKDQKSLLSVEGQYRDQLTERNTLLLTIYQYMDKILGVDKTPKRGNQAETKPFTNFSVFHDNLITRLKALSQIQLDFDKRCKEIEGRFVDKLGEMRKQLDNRWKQIDKFESSVKVYAEAKTTWRKKLSAKEGELEAIKATNIEMAAQLSSVKKPGQTDGMELRSLSARATNAERRLINTQNQLAAAEEKIESINKKNSAADTKWEVRVKEYESRLKAAEERVKRERQGGKERVGELENSIKSLQRQFEVAQKRNHQLTDVIEASKVPVTPNKS